ncbi:ribosomal protein S18-alanine N-acetyltransferase [Kineococcus terrestris]|uniref:ribosomal protein S18-alanine N-acetyltransferase n=1 Tax=Kineococcus terrestris TaxID=2044856 RepID=UPI0034DB3394
MEVRAMRWWDVAAVHRLEQELFGPTAWSAETFWGELAHPGRTYLVAVEPAADGGPEELLGYGGVVVPGADADVQTLGVAPGAQRRGLGRTLLRRLVTAARDGGATHLLLEVRADNEPAQALYLAEGFRRIARRARYYQPGDVDALVLRADLRGSAGGGR